MCVYVCVRALPLFQSTDFNSRLTGVYSEYPGLRLRDKTTPVHCKHLTIPPSLTHTHTPALEFSCFPSPLLLHNCALLEFVWCNNWTTNEILLFFFPFTLAPLFVCVCVFLWGHQLLCSYTIKCFHPNILAADMVACETGWECYMCATRLWRQTELFILLLLEYFVPERTFGAQPSPGTMPGQSPIFACPMQPKWELSRNNLFL